jgi:predicted transcriptional regulator
MSKKFDSIYENLLKEYSPIDIVPGYEGTGGEAPAEFPVKSEGKYSLTPEETKAALEEIVSGLREAGGHSDKTYKEFQEQDIVNAIKSVKPLSGTNAKYAARVLHNALKSAGIITDERDGGIKLSHEPSEEETEEVVSEVSAEGGEDVESSDEAPKKSSAINRFTPSSTIDYTFEDEVRAGSLEDAERRIYEIVDKGSVYTGADLLDYLSGEIKLDNRKDLNDRKVTSILNKLIAKGVLTGTRQKGNDTISALEPDTENMRDVEHDTFDKYYKSAMDDYKASGSGPDHGVDFG